jgi:hypothetical protein
MSGALHLDLLDQPVEEEEESEGEEGRRVLALPFVEMRPETSSHRLFRQRCSVGDPF